MAAVALNVLANTRPLRRELRRARQAWRQFRQDVNEAGGGFQGFQAGIGGLVRGAGGVAAVATVGAGALAGLGVAALRVAEDFDEARKSIIRATGATGASLDGLVADARAVFRVVPASFREVADVVGVVATAFSDEATPAIRQASEAIIDLANFGGLAADQAAVSVGKIANLWGIATNEVRAFADQLVAAGQDGGIALGDLFTATQRLTPQFQALGLTAEQTIDVIAQIDKAGIPVRKVGALLDSFLTTALRLGVEPGPAFRALLEDVGNLTTGAEQLRRAGEDVTGAYASVVVTLANANIEIKETNQLLAENKNRLDDVTKAGQSVRDNLRETGNAAKELGASAAQGLGVLIEGFNRAVHAGRPLLDTLLRIAGLSDYLNLDGPNSDTGRTRAGLRSLRERYSQFFNTDPTDEQLREFTGLGVADWQLLRNSFDQEARNRAAANDLDDQLSAVVSGFESGEISSIDAFRRLGQIAEAADTNPYGAGIASAARGERSTVGEARVEENYEAGLREVADAVTLAQARYDAGIGSIDAVVAALELQRDLIDPARDPLLEATNIRALAEAYGQQRTTGTAVDELTGLIVGAASDAVDPIRELGGAASEASQAITAATSELTRFADGIIVLNDATQAWQPDEIIDQTVMGNSVLTSLGRRATASSATQTTDGGVHGDPAGVS